MTTLRNQLSVENCFQKSITIFDRIPKTWIEQSDNIHCYVGMIQKREVNTLTLLARLLRMKKNIFVPVINQDGKMISVPLHHLEDLTEGPLGLLQPKISNDVTDVAFDLIIVPGLAFDRLGNRLGYGKGFYDRFLTTQNKTKKIGLCFDFQLLDQVIVTDEDVRLDVVITESEVITIRN